MPIQILTIDDSKTIRLIVARAFRLFDCEMLEASNGVEGLAVASRHQPDVIILDLTMPIMDGTEMLSALKSDPELKHIPVVMLTAEAGRENVLRIAKLGVRDYLIKPFKEELVIERIGRIVDLQPRSGRTQVRRMDDPLQVLVVDDKPAIVERIKTGLSEDTPWIVQGQGHPSEALTLCMKNPPDVALISLSLPDGLGFALFKTLRSEPRTKAVPVFGLSVKTAVEEQTRAQKDGFTGVITKPIDIKDLKSKVARALNLDSSYECFQKKNGALIIKFPENWSTSISNQISNQLNPKISEAVDEGLDRLILDLSDVEKPEMSLIQLGIDAIKLSEQLSLKHGLVGNESIRSECKNFEETQSWEFYGSVDEVESELA
ncbi:MAG: response regulator [Verrucomicrobia bacterium]|nr:response regulator [Verrucomicrobiota bacterium]MCF7707281.1 response regulator [Verrucomicrobiota bacterium]